MDKDRIGIEKPGIYRARNGKLLTITHAQDDVRAGHITGTTVVLTWNRDGECLSDAGRPLDVVEHLSPKISSEWKTGGVS